MKKVIINLVFLLVGIYIGLSIYNPCDVNRNGEVTASDYMEVKNFIMRGDDK